MDKQQILDAEINDIEILINDLKIERMMETNQLKKNDLTKQIDSLITRLENEYGLLYNEQ